MGNKLRNVNGVIQRESEFGFLDTKDATYWDDVEHIHLCESSIVQRGIRLVWTLCGKDVPANKGYRMEKPHRVTCPKCLAHQPTEYRER